MGDHSELVFGRRTEADGDGGGCQRVTAHSFTVRSTLLPPGVGESRAGYRRGWGVGDVGYRRVGCGAVGYRPGWRWVVGFLGGVAQLVRAAES